MNYSQSCVSSDNSDLMFFSVLWILAKDSGGAVCNFPELPWFSLPALHSTLQIQSPHRSWTFSSFSSTQQNSGLCSVSSPGTEACKLPPRHNLELPSVNSACFPSLFCSASCPKSESICLIFPEWKYEQIFHIFWVVVCGEKVHSISSFMGKTELKKFPCKNLEHY